MGGVIWSIRLTDLCAVCCLLTVAQAFSQDTHANRAPVPPALEQEWALAMARALFKSEYSKADTPAGKTVLAKKILEQADAAKEDPATHFVLLRLAQGQRTLSCFSCKDLHQEIDAPTG